MVVVAGTVVRLAAVRRRPELGGQRPWSIPAR